jgi:hypothetical protein
MHVFIVYSSIVYTRPRVKANVHIQSGMSRRVHTMYTRPRARVLFALVHTTYVVSNTYVGTHVWSCTHRVYIYGGVYTLYVVHASIRVYVRMHIDSTCLYTHAYI